MKNDIIEYYLLDWYVDFRIIGLFWVHFITDYSPQLFSKLS